MNQDIKEKWVAALNSGEYQQGKTFLRNSKNEFCCLGVLCDLYEKEHKKDLWRKYQTLEESNYFFFDETTPQYKISRILPKIIQQWSEINNELGNLDQSSTNDRLNNETLAHLNDDGKTFQEIVKVIKEKF